jgi:hypothetical protein
MKCWRGKIVANAGSPPKDLGPGDFVKVDCAACGHTALLAPAFLARLGLDPRDKVLALKDRARCRGCGLPGRAVVSIKWAKSVAQRFTSGRCAQDD